MDETFGQALRRLRSARELTQEQLGGLAHISGSYISDLERGRRHPHPDLAVELDETLAADSFLIELAAREAATRTASLASDDLTVVDLTPAEPGRPLDASDVERLRATIGHLVALDNAHGSDDIWRLAVRAYRDTDHDLAAGNYRPAVERDLRAIAGEMAEVAGWLLYDANRQDDARRLSQEALLAAQLAGDRSMELFVLSNLAMQSIHLRRGREALLIADGALASGRLSGRVAALFHARRGRALALLGDRSGALDTLSRARTLVADGVRDDDPAWAWWVDDPELVAYVGMAEQATGHPGRGADLLGESVARAPAGKRRGRYSYLVFQLDALVDAGAWRDAEQVAAELLPYVGEVGSARMVALLREVIARVGRDPRAPAGLRDVLDAAAAKIRTPGGPATS